MQEIQCSSCKSEREFCDEELSVTPPADLDFDRIAATERFVECLNGTVNISKTACSECMMTRASGTLLELESALKRARDKSADSNFRKVEGWGRGVKGSALLR